MAIYWTDTFDNLAVWRDPWPGASLSQTFAFDGSNSLKFHYTGLDSGSFADRQFGVLTEHVFFRFYYFASNMAFNSVGTKVIFCGNVSGATVPNFWLIVQTAAKIFFAWQDTADGTANIRQNITPHVAFANERWYCVEAEAKMNTPGLNDGISRIWIDGQLVLEYTTLRQRAAGNNAGFNSFRLFVQHGVGDTYYDLLSPGDERIGCVSSSSIVRSSRIRIM